MDNAIIQMARQGDRKSIARCISLIENAAEGHETIISQAAAEQEVPLIGITGPPGAGKSTLVDALVEKDVLSKIPVSIMSFSWSAIEKKGFLCLNVKCFLFQISFDRL